MSHELTERERDARLDALLQAAEADRPENHPDPEELLAFHLGSLAPEERERLEEHLTRCPECARVVLDFEAFPDLEPEAALSPQQRRALETQRRQLQNLAREDAREAGTDGAGEAGEVRGGEVIAGPWRARLRTAWSMAAVFFVATVGLSLWMARGPTVELLEPRIGPLEVHSLGTVRSEVAWTQIHSTDAPKALALYLGPAHRDFPGYRIDLLGPSGEELWSKRGFEPNERGALELQVWGGWQPPGRYWFEVYGLREGEEELVGSLGVEFVGEAENRTESPTEIR